MWRVMAMAMALAPVGCAQDANDCATDDVRSGLALTIDTGGQPLGPGGYGISVEAAGTSAMVTVEIQENGDIRCVTSGCVDEAEVIWEEDVGDEYVKYILFLEVDFSEGHLRIGYREGGGPSQIGVSVRYGLQGTTVGQTYLPEYVVLAAAGASCIVLRAEDTFVIPPL